MRQISSRQNPIVGRFRSIADAPDPTGGQILLDGVHLVRDARDAGLTFEIVAIASSRVRSNGEESQLAVELDQHGVDVIETSDEVFDALSPVTTPSGIAAIVARRPVTAAEICATENAFLLAAVDVQEPGNVGAILRSAEAGGVHGAFVCGASAHPFSWKAVRGSMGSALRLPLVGGLNTQAALTCMKKMGVRIVASVPRGGDDPDAIDWRGKVGLLVGGEGAGLAGEVVAASDARVSIPMARAVESLNVAAATAILVYSARRARHSS